MDRSQFMQQLEKLLSDIPEGERLEALDYYENYFEDAGPENEAAVIRELGSPGKVAAIIKADLSESSEEYAEYTERGYEDSRNREHTQVPDKYKQANNGSRSSCTEGRDSSQSSCAGENGGSGRKFGRAGAEAGSREYTRNTDRARRGYHAEKKINKPGIILVLILLVFLSPFIKGAVGGTLGLVLTIALLPFMIIFGLAAGVFGLLIGGAACVATGIALCFTSLGSGLLAAGVGCLLLAVGAVLLVLLLLAAFKLVPKLLRKFTDFCSHILHKRGKDGTAE